MVCLNSPKSVPVMSMLVALLANCSQGESTGDYCDCAEAKPALETTWAVPYFAEVDFLISEPDGGDTFVGNRASVKRVDADGQQLFRLDTSDAVWLRAAAFTADGNTIVLGSCDAPGTLGGASICDGIVFGTRSAVIVELDRTGQALRSTLVRPEGVNSVGVLALAVGDDDRVHLAGTFSGTADFGDGELEADGKQAIFYLQLDAQWNTRRSRDFGATSSFVSSLSVDADTGDVFMLGTFSGNASFSGIRLTSGPNGNAIFLVRLSADADARWARHYLGSGRFEARFGSDGGIFIYGRGAAPFTSFGGDRVIDGPFATKLDASGNHKWTWGSDAQSGTATIDSEGRIVALYTDQQLLTEEVIPSATCSPTKDQDWNLPGSTCESTPETYINHRILRVMSPDGTVLDSRNLGSYEQDWSEGRLAAGSDASVVVAQRQYDGELADFGTGQVFGNTVLAKLRLVPKL